MLLSKPDTTSLVLVEEFAHRALNEYTHAIATLSHAARDVGDDMARRQLCDAVDRLHAFALAHRALAMPVAGAPRDVAEYITGVCSALADAFLPETGLRLNLTTPDTVLPGDRCWRLALIISELIHNALRHGGRDGEIVVELTSIRPELICRVSNSGACPSAPGFGRGRRIVSALAEELGGSANWVFSPSGASVWVILPLDDDVKTNDDPHWAH